jgi:hypothetical protein
MSELIEKSVAIAALKLFKKMEMPSSKFDDSPFGKVVLEVLDGEHKDTINDCIMILEAIPVVDHNDL